MAHRRPSKNTSTPTQQTVNPTGKNSNPGNQNRNTLYPARVKIDGPITVNDGDKTEHREQRIRERAKIIVEALTLGAVVFYGIVAYNQWRAMLVANMQTQQALKIAQSPNVFVNQIKYDPLTVGSKITGTVQFVNTGNLPALNFFFGGVFEMAQQDPTLVQTVQLAGVGEFDMPPNLEYGDQLPEPLSSNDALSPSDWQAFLNGTEKLYAVGDFKYRTGFQNPDGTDEVDVRPFCRWWAYKSDQAHMCPFLNTKYHENPPNQPKQQ
ncbi:MAG: hypothetical protein ABSC63_07405 [Candidatus Binataceae bacterium]|jgi:hypothetical protein